MKNFSSFSIPIKSLFVLIQAIAVEPLPIQLSNTKSPSFVNVKIKFSNKAIGFCVGCRLLVKISRLNSKT
nr:MAG TPA: hypothetical protein [Caudoviricetes sp.]